VGPNLPETRLRFAEPLELNLCTDTLVELSYGNTLSVKRDYGLVSYEDMGGLCCSILQSSAPIGAMFCLAPVVLLSMPISFFFPFQVNK